MVVFWSVRSPYFGGFKDIEFEEIAKIFNPFLGALEKY
ncbi:hypothetical protein LCGC14_1687260 [marine sediment metagenome]|uniref:Uncharacterized protein n=1 Tax=marine sediment metagenome TaxID=412755 RepID=A0A0F9I9D6_9ZZZZ